MTLLDHVPIFAALDALTGVRRHEALIAYARSPDFTAAAMLPMDGFGVSEGEFRAHELIRRISREAYATLKAELDRETPARAWHRAFDKATFRTDHRAICKALRIDPDDRFALYATLPFRIIRNEGERPWIAGAIGCPRPFSQPDWLHVDISDVILWNPRTNALQLAGDPTANLIEAADWDNGRYTVFSDGASFFRAWAERRAILGAEILIAKQTGKVIPREPVDSSMPGALAIGDLTEIRWRDLHASVLVAGPGTDPERLKRAIWRSANLPRVEAPEHLKAAA